MIIQLSKEQLEAIDKMKVGCILCGGVGSGKSRTSLAYFWTTHGQTLEDYIYELKMPKLVIITTAKKRETREWEMELVFFKIVVGTSDEEQLSNHYTRCECLIDSWNNIRKYDNLENCFFIFDEQRVVGYGAWAQSFMKIAKKNDWVLLSATPGDRWDDYIPVFIANGFYRNKTEFIREHIVYSRFSKYPKVDRYLNIKKLTYLRDSILVDIVDRRVTNSIHETVKVDYDKDKYNTMLRTRWDIYKNRPFKNAGTLCAGLRHVVNEHESRSVMTLEIFEKHPQLIIFYNFDYELDILLNLYYGPNVEIAQWNGHKHQPVPNSDSWVYLVQYTAGAEGWNCITTDSMMFYSQTYSYKILAQACGRIDRLNTPFRDLYYYHQRSSASIDLAINKTLKQKKEFNTKKFAGGYFDQPASNQKEIILT